MGLLSPIAVLRSLMAHPIGARRKLRTALRYVGWQTLGRLQGGRTLDPWVNGARLYVKHGMAGATGNLYVGLHEFEEMAFLLHFLRPEELFVDVGANVGSYTILASAAIGARVIAFEPVAATHAALLRNVALNDAEARVDARQVAISDRPGTLRVTTEADTMNRVMRTEHPAMAGFQNVEAQTLDAALDGEQPLLLKIDVEGHEGEVLRGAEAVLAQKGLHALLVEDWGCVATPGEAVASPATLLARHGFERCAYDPFRRSLATRIEAPLGPQESERQNSIFVRDVGFVRDRLQEAPLVRVLGLQI